MDKYQIAARVLAAASEKGTVVFGEFCEQYTAAADDARLLLQPYAKIDVRNSGVPAASRMGAGINSPMGAARQAFTARISLNEGGVAFTEGKSEGEILQQLKATH